MPAEALVVSDDPAIYAPAPMFDMREQVRRCSNPGIADSYRELIGPSQACMVTVPAAQDLIDRRQPMILESAMAVSLAAKARGPRPANQVRWIYAGNASHRVPESVYSAPMLHPSGLGLALLSDHPLWPAELIDAGLAPMCYQSLGHIAICAAVAADRPLVLGSREEANTAFVLHRDPRSDRRGPWRLTPFTAGTHDGAYLSISSAADVIEAVGSKIVRGFDRLLISSGDY